MSVVLARRLPIVPPLNPLDMARRGRPFRLDEDQARLGWEGGSIARVLRSARASLGGTGSVIEAYFCKQDMAANPDGRFTRATSMPDRKVYGGWDMRVQPAAQRANPFSFSFLLEQLTDT